MDKSRVNEFGFSGEMEEKNKQQLSNGQGSEAVAAIEDKPADNNEPTKTKSKQDKKRD